VPNPDARRPRNGFSLVELMVVLALLGLAAGAVILTMRPPGGDALSEASRFAVRAAALRDRAVVEGRPMRLWVAASGYGFEERHSEVWAATTDRSLQPHDWPDGVAASVNGAAVARISFDRLGLPDQAVTLQLRRGDGEAAVSIDAAGGVRVQ
jgi:general secretion pathway protein H